MEELGPKEELRRARNEELTTPAEPPTPPLNLPKSTSLDYSGRNSVLGKRVEQQAATLRLLLDGQLSIKKMSKHRNRGLKSPQKSPIMNTSKTLREEQKIERMGTYIKRRDGIGLLNRGDSISFPTPKALTCRHKSTSKFLPMSTQDEHKEHTISTNINTYPSQYTLQSPRTSHPTDTDTNINTENILNYKKLEFKNLNYDKIGAHGRVHVDFNYLRPVTLKGNTKGRGARTWSEQFAVNRRSEYENIEDKDENVRTMEYRRSIAANNIASNHRINGGVKGKGRDIYGLINNGNKSKQPQKNWVFKQTLIGNEVSEVRKTKNNQQNILLPERRNNNLTNSSAQATQQIRTIYHKRNNISSPFERAQKLVELYKRRPGRLISKSPKQVNQIATCHSTRGLFADEMSSKFFITTDGVSNLDADKGMMTLTQHSPENISNQGKDSNKLKAIYVNRNKKKGIWDGDLLIRHKLNEKQPPKQKWGNRLSMSPQINNN